MMRHVMPLKKLIELNQDESKIPVFQDEVHFQAQTTITRVWAEKGSAPKVYPFWSDKAILEIELRDEGEDVRLPQEIKVI